MPTATNAADTLEDLQRTPSLSEHQQYLATLRCPTPEERRRISLAQIQKEREIDSKYHTSEESAAASKIQRAYRGHRERRQLDGLTLDPSSRWDDLIREMRYRAATVPRRDSNPEALSNTRSRASSRAHRNWQLASAIAEHAVEGGRTRSKSNPSSTEVLDPTEASNASEATMLLDQRYFLEMVDQKHRYGINLQVYHEEWLRSTTNQNFFFWLDHGDGQYIDLPGCTREKLDRETIRYLSRDERIAYLVDVDDHGKMRWHKTGELISTSREYKDSMTGIVSRDDVNAASFRSEDVQRRLSEERLFANELANAAELNEPLTHPDDSKHGESATSLHSISSMHLDASISAKRRHHLRISPATVFNHLLRACVRPGTWIYVTDSIGRLYVGIKSSGAFQHTSFLAGARISSAGLIGIEQGQLTYLSPMSGHYRPTSQSFRRFLNNLKDLGVNLSQVKISHAYEVLVTMEMYARVKKAVHLKKIGRGREEQKDSREFVQTFSTAETAWTKHDSRQPNAPVRRLSFTRPRRLSLQLRRRRSPDHEEVENVIHAE